MTTIGEKLLLISAVCRCKNGNIYLFCHKDTE